MKLNQVDLNKLHVFMQVVRHGGYSGAMAELGLTRSAISQTILNLESSLGVPLFKRVGKKLVPTDKAVEFCNELSESYSLVEGSVARLLESGGGRCEGVLRIGAYFEFTKSRLMPFIKNFMTAHPKTQLHFRFDSPSRLAALLDDGKIDLSLTIYPHKSKSLTTLKMYEEELLLLASPKLLGPRPQKKELTQVPWIDYFSSHKLFQRWWGTHYDGKAPTPQVRSYAASAEMVLELVSQELGVGIVPRYVYEDNVKAKNLTIVQPSADRLYDYIWLSHHDKNASPFQVQQFIAELKSYFGVRQRA